HAAAEAGAAQVGAHRDVEHVRFAGAVRHDAVAADVAVDFHHPADVADTYAVAEHALAPRKLIRAALDDADLRDVGQRHRPDATGVGGTRRAQLGAHAAPSRFALANVCIASTRSCQDLRFSPGLRSRYAG